MHRFRRRVLIALAELARPARSREALETVALMLGALAFVVGFPVSLLLFWGHQLAITGPWSIGWYAAIGGAIVAGVAFILGRVAVRPRDAAEGDPRDGFLASSERLRWYDLIAIALAYAAIALLGWLGIAQLLELSFIDAPVFALPGAALVGVAFALTGYVAFLGGASLTPMSLSLTLAIFLVMGAFTAMLNAGDPHWWRDNLSALGMSSNVSAPAFNITLLISGIMVTTIGRYATDGLPVDQPHLRRNRRLVRTALVLIGILLACVALFPVDRFFLVHNSVATGMAVVYAALIFALPKLLPTLPKTFYALGYIYVAVVALLAVFFVTGYYNLTAVELIAGILIFSWIIVFLRVASAAGTQPAAEVPAEDASLSTP